MNRSLMITSLAVASLLAAAAVAQPNLQPFQPSGWALPLVPRPAADGAWNYVPGPTTLPGNAASTYWNESCWNAGSSPTGGNFTNQLSIDGVVEGSYFWGALPAGSYSTHTNGGPVTVRGGRHTFELRVDGTNAIGESNETDNNFARQWIWTPLALAAGAQATRGAPPDPQGGWAAIPLGQEKFANCDGFRFTVGTGWDVVTARVLDTAADYDVYLHSPSPGASQGFADPLSSSERRGGGGLDGVITNGRFLGGLNYDVGVVRYWGSGNYVAEHIVSQTLAFDDSLTSTLGQNQALRIWEVPFGVADVGEVTVTLRMLTGSGSVMLQWLDRAFQRGGMNDSTAGTATDDASLARLSVNVTTPGYYAVVVRRDPIWGLGQRSFTLEVERALPDVVPTTPPGWSAPLVPRQESAVSYENVTLPDSLWGYWQWNTYFNFAAANTGLGPCPSDVQATVYLDGQPIMTRGLGVLLPSQNGRLINQAYPSRVYGGRHTLSLRTDAPGLIEETNEDNNIHAVQYCWTPEWLWPPWYGYEIERAAPPPPPYGGHEDLTGGDPFWPNCDGFRFGGAYSGYFWAWTAVVVMPLGGGDVNLACHPMLTGLQNGFAAPLAQSDFGPGQPDFIVVDYHSAPHSHYDAAVTWVSGSSGYRIENDVCGNLVFVTPDPTIWTIGPIPPGHIMLLYDADLPAGLLALRLQDISGGVDWGLAIFAEGVPYQGSDRGVRVNEHGPGADNG